MPPRGDDVLELPWRWHPGDLQLTAEELAAAEAPPPLPKRRRRGQLQEPPAAGCVDPAKACALLGAIRRKVDAAKILSVSVWVSRQPQDEPCPDLRTVRTLCDLQLYTSSCRLQADILNAVVAALARAKFAPEPDQDSLADILRQLPELVADAGLPVASFVRRAADLELPRPAEAEPAELSRRAAVYTEIVAALRSALDRQDAFDRPPRPAEGRPSYLPPLGLNDVLRRAAFSADSGGYATDGEYEMDLRLVADGAKLFAEAGSRAEKMAGHLGKMILEQMMQQGLVPLCCPIEPTPAWPGIPAGAERDRVMRFLDRWEERCKGPFAELLLRGADDDAVRARVPQPMDLNTLRTKVKLGLLYSLHDFAYDLRLRPVLGASIRGHSRWRCSYAGHCGGRLERSTCSCESWSGC
eukprot:TRINITY_DN7007_c0_g1_i3.p1 TRINITY_DN7007_c0_g1~~TRINITY_DN7007_c0_g1_i3.p1  ORF type:complete len:429 (+),score=125.35 TRINITY_DN7007_c0_g1_i3:53-1288(+)